jgi:hypothetical protein
VGHGSVLVAQDGVDLVAHESALEREFRFEQCRFVIGSPPDAEWQLSIVSTGFNLRLVRVNRTPSAILAADKGNDCGSAAMCRRAETGRLNRRP